MIAASHRFLRLASQCAPVVLTSFLAACAGGGEPTPAPDTADASAVASAMPEARPALPARPGARAQRVDVRRDTTTFGTGPAVVTLTSGDTVVVSDSAVRAWRLGDGALVAVSGLDGAGGFENEGQSLTVIDLTSGARRRVVSDYYPIVRVELVESTGARALLVHMRDGGVGSLHVTVVDPGRGPVFRAQNAVGRVTDGVIVVSSYGDGETPVDFGDRRPPLRVDTLVASTVDTASLLVVPRAPR